MSVSRPSEPTGARIADSTASAEDILQGPVVWLLLDDRPGHTTQAVGLAEALGWPYETKILHFNALNRLSNRLLGASRLSLKTGNSDSLAAPWPDLVIAMGRRTAPIARWIKRRSGGRCRLVQLGRKAVNLLDGFDLAVTCRHFRQPADPRRHETLLPLTQVTEKALAAARSRWQSELAAPGNPWVVLLVGGTTAHHRLTAAAARRMAGEAQAFAEALGGGLSIVSSRRTGQAATAALRAGAPAADLHEWRAGRTENPYLGYLALADVLVVTGESESMLAEAAWAGKPLYIYPIEDKPASLRTRVGNKVLAWAERSPDTALGRLGAVLIRRGWVLPPRDLAVMHAEMVASGIAVRFGSGETPAGAAALPDLGDLCDRIEALVAAGRRVGDERTRTG